jgi:SAM-dependent methyltransferase
MSAYKINSHVVFDKESRFKKAKKIINLLETITNLNDKIILDIGTGSGYISSYIGQFAGKGVKVFSVDITDNRKTKEGFEFEIFSGDDIPYANNKFDIVITNHVIEHVGNRSKQLNHLREINRVLKEDGLVYFAVPNKWSIIEPHYKLPFLSWLPAIVASFYIRITKKGAHYDCLILSHRDAINLFKETHFNYQQETFNALRIMSKVENKSFLFRKISGLPDALLKLIYPIIPTLIFILKNSEYYANK